MDFWSKIFGQKPKPEELLQACIAGDFQKALTLIQAKVNVNALLRDYEKEAEMQKIGSSSSVDKMYTTPLYKSVSANNFELVKLLVNKGADVNLVADDRGSPLSQAAFNGCFEIVQYLIKKGANCNMANKDGYRPIEAALLGHRAFEVVHMIDFKLESAFKSIVEELILAGTNLRNRPGGQPAYVLAMSIWPEIAPIIKEHIV